MGATHGELRRKNKSSSTLMKQGKKNLNKEDQNSRITFGKNQSKMTKDFKNEYETTDNKPQSKTDKTIDDTKKIEEDIKNKSHLDKLKIIISIAMKIIYRIHMKQISVLQKAMKIWLINYYMKIFTMELMTIIALMKRTKRKMKKTKKKTKSKTKKKRKKMLC